MITLHIYFFDIRLERRKMMSRDVSAQNVWIERVDEKIWDAIIKQQEELQKLNEQFVKLNENLEKMTKAINRLSGMVISSGDFKEVVNEDPLCTCRHKMSDHGNMNPICHVNGCTCRDFTF
jgi:hypothetical protein